MEDVPETVAETAPETGNTPTTPPESDETRTHEAPVRPRPSPIKSESKDRGPTPNLPALPGGRSRTLEVAGWVGLAAFLLLVIGGGYLFRDDIVRAWPPSERLYTSLGVTVMVAEEEPSLAPLEDRLRFRDLRPAQRFVDGVLTLVIEGRVENIGPVTELVPPIEVVLLDERQLDLMTSLFEAAERRLEPGQSTIFETRIENPPPEAMDIRVTFAAGNSAGNSGASSGTQER